jgi:hypothetical protein
MSKQRKLCLLTLKKIQSIYLYKLAHGKRWISKTFLQKNLKNLLKQEMLLFQFEYRYIV